MYLRGIELALALDLVNQNDQLLDYIFTVSLECFDSELPQSFTQLRDQLRILVDPCIHILVANPTLYNDNSRYIVWNRISSRLGGVPDLSPFRYPNIIPHRHFRLDDQIRGGLPEIVRESLPLNNVASYGLPEWLEQAGPHQEHQLQSSQQHSSLINSLSLEVDSKFNAYQPASLAAASDFLFRLSCLGLGTLQADAINAMSKTGAVPPPPGVCKYCHLVRQINTLAAGARMTTTTAAAAAAAVSDKVSINRRLARLRKAFACGWGFERHAEANASQRYARVRAGQPAPDIVYAILAFLAPLVAREGLRDKRYNNNNNNNNDNSDIDENAGPRVFNTWRPWGYDEYGFLCGMWDDDGCGC
ncbi:hypothetical protein F4809DRAFT_640651 [Biscogniauxia mediterranea]|nr:hypothetical protein F4809DRAFT_640651 [Biscogniauxia mediterranea]